MHEVLVQRVLLAQPETQADDQPCVDAGGCPASRGGRPGWSGSAAAPYNWQSESEVALLVPRCSSSASCLPAAHGGAAMCGAAGSPRTGLRRVGRGGQDPSELASRCAAATGLSCRASRCMSGSASVPAAQLPTAASRCATLQALHTPVHQMWGGAARTPARASTVVDNTCPQKGKMFFSVCGRTPPVGVLSNRLGPRGDACRPGPPRSLDPLQRLGRPALWPEKLNPEF